MTQGTPVGEEADHDDSRGDRDEELRGLRLRAYGPDADIASDPAAQARLRELEDRLRTAAEPVSQPAPQAPPRFAPHAASAPASRPSVPSVPPIPPLPTAAARAAGAPPAATSGPTTSYAPPAAPETVASEWSRWVARWARNPRAIAVAAVALLVILALAIVPGLFTERPEATLRVDPAHAGESFEWGTSSYLRQLDLEAEDFARFESYGELEVWATPGSLPRRCIFVFAGENNIWGAGCVPRGLDPSADVQIQPGDMPRGMREALPDLPEGSVIRFTLRGDTIEVRVAIAEPIDAVD